MKRNALLCGALLAACGGGNKKNSVPSGELGAVHDTADRSGATQQMPAMKPDPATEFRMSYSDPGGMWMPSQMTVPQHAENFQKMGVKLDPAQLADPLKEPLAAVVWLGGCTASLVSPDGLIVTNHHCVQGSLQLNSTPEKNYQVNGFLAKTKADELPAGPSQHVMVLQAYRDVTKEMRDGLEKVKDSVARKEESEKRQKELIHACEKDRPELRCQVSSFFGGSQYTLYEFLDIKDVRLVYVPARSVGDYGGEIDNWEWPRHTGDWSFYRAYVGKDGKPADPAADNVPFHPKHWLHVTTAGLKPNDFVMVTGYPGRTNRNETASELHHDLEWYYPYIIAYDQELYDFAKSHTTDSGETAIKATTLEQFTQNGLEKYQGIVQGFQKNPDLMASKDAEDKKLKEWIGQPGHEQYKQAVEKMEGILAEQNRTARVDFDRGVAFRGSKLLSTALSFTRWADERTKKDADRKPGYQDRDMPRAIGGQKQFVRSYDEVLDRGQFRLALVRALQLPEADRPWLATLLGTSKGQKIDEALIDKTLDGWYKASTLTDEKLRMELLQKGTMAQLKASKDPFIQAAQRIYPLARAQEKKEDARVGDLMLVTPLYMDALKQVLGGALAPDANSTLRITYGTVKSLKPQSKEPADWPFTIASQILAKDTGKDPFNSPPKLLEAIKAKKFGPYGDPSLGGELPIDFESDLDITGGNSGSPTLNNKGELVGLAFDGNKEGLASDAVFDGKTTRTIHVDARYMIWTMDLLDGADHLIKEMGLEPKLQ
ncbi:MAG: S46 family peptidase [Deltaproteobacteria bacterium]|nr:S46 family peptidase [Deltaproteobacteria bacterium]